MFSLFFLNLTQNPVKKIPDTHEIVLQHGTKTVRLLLELSLFNSYRLNEKDLLIFFSFIYFYLAGKKNLLSTWYKSPHT